MTLMNLLLIETFKSTKLNFQKLHLNSHIFCKQILEWFASQQKFSLPIEEQSKQELNRCLQVFYASVRQKNGSEFKVSSLRAIRGAIDRYLKQPPNNKPRSIIGDSEFAKPTKR